MEMSSITLKHYRRLARWLPFNALGDKLAAAAFFAINLPLLVLLAYAVANGRVATPQAALFLTTMATLLGSALALWALRHLLMPIRHAERALQMYRFDSRVMPLPTDLRDDMGQFLRDLRRMLETAEERRSQLDLLSFDDEVTGLPNRRNAENYLNLAAAATERAGVRLTIAVLELDEYHGLVERLGTEGGNRALQLTAEFLQATLHRKTDWLARWSAARFVAVLFTDQHSATEYMAGVSRDFARAMRNVEGQSLSLSSGFSEVRRHDDVIDCVERAMESIQRPREEGGENVVGLRSMRSFDTPAARATQDQRISWHRS